MQGDSNNNAESMAEYLAQLLKDKNRLSSYPNVFLHVERILDKEINQVRSCLFKASVKNEPMSLPEPEGAIEVVSEKVYVPIDEHPDFNFVGRILGPRGTTIKQLEQDIGCKMMIRGKGSMREKKKEEMNKGKPNWEHLDDQLHVLITVEDTPNRAVARIARAVEEVKKLMEPVTDGKDELKKMQLMELAIINGTYRSAAGAGPGPVLDATKLPSPTSTLAPSAFGGAPATHLGTQLFLQPPRLQIPTGTTLLGHGNEHPSLLTCPDNFLYSPYAYHHYAALLGDFNPAAAAAGAVFKQRKFLGARDHPYRS